MLFLFAIAMILAGGGAFLAVYSYMAIEDLVADNTNPIDTCKSLNSIVPFDIGCHLAIVLVTCSRWYFLLWNLPVLLYNLNECYKSWTAGDSVCNLYDPTRILRKYQYSRIQIVSIGKIAFYAVSLILYFVYIIASAILQYSK